MSDPNPRISEIIAALQKIRIDHGDLRCVYETYGTPFLPKVINRDGKTLVDLAGDGSEVDE